MQTIDHVMSVFSFLSAFVSSKKNRTHCRLLSHANQVQYADFSPEPGRETVSVSSAHVRLTQTDAPGGAGEGGAHLCHFSQCLLTDLDLKGGAV